jgi:hypothetical protein
MAKPKKDELRELVGLLTLQQIQYYVISAEVNETPREDAPAVGVEVNGDIDVEWGCKIRVVGNEFGARLRAEVNDVDGRIVVDVAAEYEAPDELTITRELAFDYVNEVAVMQLLPFVRETVNTMSAKVLHKPLLMPVYQRGEIGFSPDRPTATT